MERTSCRSMARMQVQRADEVVVVVLQRLPDRFAHGLQAGEVDDGVDRCPGEDGVDGGLVHQVHLVEAACLPLSSATRRSDSSLEFTRLSMTTTSWPASCRDSTVCDPM